MAIEVGQTTLFKTFTNFHQLILWEIAANLPLATIQNLLIAVKGNKHITNTLMPIVNSYMNRCITKYNMAGTRFCLSKSVINRPLETKKEIEFVCAEITKLYNQKWEGSKEILCMLNYLENNPTREEQMQISHILISVYIVGFYPKIISDDLPQITFNRGIKNST